MLVLRTSVLFSIFVSKYVYMSDKSIVLMKWLYKLYLAASLNIFTFHRFWIKIDIPGSDCFISLKICHAWIHPCQLHFSFWKRIEVLCAYSTFLPFNLLNTEYIHELNWQYLITAIAFFFFWFRVNLVV